MNRPLFKIFVAIITVVVAVFAWRMALTERPSSIWFGDRYYTANELFPDPNAAALAEAAGRGDDTQVDLLINAKADPNYVGKFDYTPAMWTIEVGSIEGFRHLLRRGARLDIPSRLGLSSMALASGPAKSVEFLEAALRSGGNPNFVEMRSGDTPLFFAVRSGDVERVKLLVESGANINARNLEGTTPLIECAGTGEFGCAWVLLKHGANPRLAEPSGADFSKALQLGRRLPFWTRNYWWRRKVEAFLSHTQESLSEGGTSPQSTK